MTATRVLLFRQLRSDFSHSFNKVRHAVIHPEHEVSDGNESNHQNERAAGESKRYQFASTNRHVGLAQKVGDRKGKGDNKRWQSPTT